MTREQFIGIAAVTMLVMFILAAVGMAISRSRPPHLGMVPEPDSYRITYRVEEHIESPERSTQVVEADRPYRTRVRRYDHATIREHPDLVRIVTPDGLFFSQGTELRHTEMAAPGLPQDDLRLAASLPEAMSTGLVESDGDREKIVGRTCTWFSTQEPLGAGDWQPPSSGDRATSCVDAEGLLLEERWWIANRLVQERRATDVQVGTTNLSDRELFGRSGPPIHDRADMGTRLEYSNEPRWITVRASSPPPDLSLDLAVDVGSGAFSTSGLEEAHRIIYRGGTDVLIVDQRQTSAHEPDGRRVRLGRLGEGWLLPSPNGLRVTVIRSPMITLEVQTTLERPALLRWMQDLNPLGEELSS